MDILIFDNRLFPFCFPAALSFLACAFLVYITINGDKTKSQNRYIGLFFALLGIINLGDMIVHFAATGPIALFIYRLQSMALLFGLPVFVQLVHLITKRSETIRIKWTKWGLFGLCTGLAPLVWTDLFASKTKLFSFGWFIQAGPLYYALVTGMSIAMIYVVVSIIRHNCHDLPRMEQYKAKFILVCIVTSYLLMIGDVIPASGVALFPLGDTLFIPLLVLIVGVFRKDLFDINPFVRKRILGNVVKLLVSMWFAIAILTWYLSVYRFNLNYILNRVFPFGIPPLLTLLACGYLATLSLRLGQNQREALIFSLICLLYGFLNLDILILGIVTSKETALLISRLDHMFFIFATSLSLHLTYLVTARKNLWIIVYIAYILGLILMPLTQTRYYFPDMYHYYWGYFAKGGVLFDAFGAFSLLIIIYCNLLLISGYRKANNDFFRQRILFLALGFGGFGILTIGNVPTLKGYEFYPPGNFAFIPLVLTSYGLFKNNLKQALKITKVWLFWPFLLLALLGITWILKSVLQINASLRFLFVATIAAVVAYRAIKPILESLLTMIFGRPEEKLERILESMMDDLSQAHTFQSIYATIKRPVFEELISENCAMLVLTDPSFSDKNWADNSEHHFSGYNTWNAAQSLFKSRHWHSQKPEPIDISPDHPIISLLCQHRTLLTNDQIQTWLANQIMIANDQPDPAFSHSGILFHAALVQPIFFQEQLTCLILIGYKINGSEYMEDEKDFIKRLAMALGPPIENAKLLQSLEAKVLQRTQDLKFALEETRKKEQEIARINEFVRIVNSTLDFDEVMLSISQVIQEIFSFDQISILLIDEKKQILSLYKGYSRLSLEKIEEIKEITFSLDEPGSIFIESIQNKKPIYFDKLNLDILKNADYRDLKAYEINPVKSILLQPLEIQNKVIGLINFSNTRDHFELSDRKIQKIQQYVTHVATAINNARLAQEIQKALWEAKNKEKEIAHINQVVQTVNSTLDFDTVAHSVIKVLFEIFEFDIMAVLLIDETGEQLDIYRFYGERIKPEHINQYQAITFDLKAKDSVASYVVYKKKPLYLTNVRPEKIINSSDRRLWEVIPFDTVLILPLESQNQVFGTINFITIDQQIELTHTHIEKIQQYVSHIAAAIYNAKVYNDLENARKLTEEAAQAKSDFLANMSHEIRTPMNAIIGLGRLALRTELSLKQKDYLEKILQSARSLLGIIDDILDFSKIEAGMMNIDSIEFDLYAVLDNIADLVNIRTDRKNLDLALIIDKGVPLTLIGDPLRLSQILTNLVGNAIKFTAQGSIEVRVRQIEPFIADESKTDPQVYLEFSVKDTGIGMTPDQIDKLFQSFAQADTSITRKYGGTGLGLAISKRLVEMLGGQIWVDSEPQKGSTFSFTAQFGLAASAQTSDIAPGMEYQPAVFEPVPDVLTTLQGARILLTEDNIINQQVARELLESAGMIVEIANNGSQALEKLIQSTQESQSPGSKYHAVLMDLQMPEMDGFTATHQIRSLSSDIRDIPIIAMTAHAMDKDQQKCREAGMNDYVVKPIEPDILLTTLIKWIRPEQIDTRSQKISQRVMPPETHLPDVLPGFDITSGLKRTNDNKALYGKLLSMFYQKYQEAFSIISGMIDASGFERIKEFAHEIKGVCGNLGAHEFSQVFAAIETAAKDRNREKIENLLLQHTSQFVNVMIGVENLINELSMATQNRTPQKQTAGSTTEAIDQIRQIIDIMEIDYSQAMDQFMALKGTLYFSEFQDEISRIEQDLNMFDENEVKMGLTQLYHRLESAREKNV